MKGRFQMADSPQNLTGYTLTASEIAKKLHYHPQYVRFLASQGKLPALKRGRMWLFNEIEVFKFLKAGSPNESARNESENAGDDSILS